MSFPRTNCLHTLLACMHDMHAGLSKDLWEVPLSDKPAWVLLYAYDSNMYNEQ